MTSRDSAPAQSSRRARWWRTAERAIAVLAVGYFVTVIAVGYETSRLYFGYRLLETNLTDFSWQLELPWRASLGQWSGRDFQFPMGPAWQLLGYLSWLAGGGVSGVVAGLELIAATVAAASVLALFRGGASPLLLRVSLASAALVWTSAAGSASIRALLSLGLVVAYSQLRVESRLLPTAKRGLLAATLLVLGGLMSFDRVVLGAASVVGMAGWELGVLRLRGMSRRPAWMRLAGFGAAALGVTAVTSVLAMILGASPLTWLGTQIALSGSYTVNLAYSAHGALPGVCVVTWWVGCFVVVHEAWRGRSRPRSNSGMGLTGALVLAGFALVQPDPGHLALAFLPLVVLMLRLAARQRAQGFHRAYAGFTALLLVSGWFVARPSTWFSPRIFSDYAWARAGNGADPAFETDLARIVAFAKEAGSQEECMGFPPMLTAAHALTDVPGPTSLALRWNSSLQQGLARDIRTARCRRFVRQLAGFDHNNINWHLGADFLAIAELYAFEKHLGPATVAMKLRKSPRPPAKTLVPIPQATREQVVSPGTPLRLPLDVPVETGDILRVEYTLRSSALRAKLGYAPGLMFRFQGPDGPLHDATYVYDMSVNRRAVTYLALDPENTERSWILRQPPPMRRRATSLSLDVSPRGLLTEATARLVVHGVTRLRPAPSEADGKGQAVDCSVTTPSFVTRGAAVRTRDSSLRFRPGKPREALAAVFFEIPPCDNRCFFAELAARSRKPGSGPLRVQAHRVTGSDRWQLLDATLTPGGPGERVRVPLTGKHQWVRIGPAPLETRHTDLEILRPRFAPCMQHGPVVLGTTAQVVDGAIVPQGAHWLVEESAKLRVRLTPRADSCLQATFLLESEDSGPTRFDVGVWIEELGLRQRLLRSTINEAAPLRALGPFALQDFQERIVNLVFQLERRAGKGRLVIVDPALVRCGR